MANKYYVKGKASKVKYIDGKAFPVPKLNARDVNMETTKNIKTGKSPNTKPVKYTGKLKPKGKMPY